MSLPAPISVITFDGSIVETTADGDSVTRVGSPIAANESFSGGALNWRNADATGAGIKLVSPQLTSTSEYSIALRFSLGNVSGYRKIVDFKDRSSDNGLYIRSGVIEAYPYSTSGQTPFSNGDIIDLILVRNASGLVNAYVYNNGAYLDVLQSSPPNDGAAGPNQNSFVPQGGAFNFFVDDTVATGENPSSGSVYSIKLYNVALTSTQINQVFPPQSPTLTSATYNASTGLLAVTGSNIAVDSGPDIDVSKFTITGEGGATYTLTSSGVERTSSTAFSVTLNAADRAALNQIINKNGTSSASGTTYNIAAAANWNPANSGAADLTGNGITVSSVPVPVITSATYNAATGALVVTGTGFLSKSGAANDIDVSKLTITGQAGGTRTLTSTSVEIDSGTSFSVTLNSADQAALQSLLNQNGTSSLGGTTYNLAAAEDWAAGADAAVVVADLTGNGITVSNYTAPSSGGGGGGGGGGDTTPIVRSTVIDTTPVDPAPAGTNIQATDADGDGLREVITASDGSTIDGNRDGIPDVQQTEVAGLRLINDGAKGDDYGALVVGTDVRLSGVTLTAPASDGSIPVTARGGGAVVVTIPDGITNAFAGVVSFNVSGVTPGGTTQATISFPSGLPAGSGNAYVRFNYATNRFEYYVDATGKPLYSFVDSDGDGVFDAVNLTLVDGDPNWDGDGAANGTVVDPGFLASGERAFVGTKRRDVLTGNLLSNTIRGRKGSDWLQGGLGIDNLIGGRGKDRFVYTDAAESIAAQRDIVKRGIGDRFVFSAFDGDSTAEGRQSLEFIGKSAFSGVAGEMRGTRSVLEADINGDSLADFAVKLRGNLLVTARDLVL
jgi:hypothetical protein